MNLTEINSKTRDLCEYRVYWGFSVPKLADKFGVTADEIRRILDENKEYLSFLVRERGLSFRAKYQKLAKLSHSCLKEILETSHIDGEGVVDVEILKLKKSVAESVLENVGAKKENGKGAKIQVNTQINNRQREARVIEHTKEKNIIQLLDRCSVIDIEKAS